MREQGPAGVKGGIVQKGADVAQGKLQFAEKQYLLQTGKFGVAVQAVARTSGCGGGQQADLVVVKTGR